MKKSFMVAIALIATFSSFAQVQQAVTRSSVSDNPIKLKYEKDEFTDKEYLFISDNLLVTDDGKKGFYLFPMFKKLYGTWTYYGLAGVSTIGNCFENDKIYILFDDGTKIDMTSWRKFNCKGDLGFDLSAVYKRDLSKPMKGIKFVNGRDSQSFEKIFTDPNDKNYFINAFKALDDFNNGK